MEGSQRLGNDAEAIIYREEFSDAIEKLYSFIDALVGHASDSAASSDKSVGMFAHPDRDSDASGLDSFDFLE